MKLQMNIRRIFKRLFIFNTLFIGVLGIALIILFLVVFQKDISKLGDPLPKAMIIYDKNNEIISEKSYAKYTPVSLAEIPENLKSAIIAVEDHRFYEHSGVDIIGIARSVFKNIRAGSIVGGGSTITQQLAKNLFYTAEQTYTRKIEEAVTAIRIELKYSKDDILELYLNQIYFGEGAWGVQDASQMYFGKDIQDINLSEAALLAALPKAPSYYSPFKNEDKAMERRNLVLKILYDEEIIDKKKYDQAVKENIVLRDWELEEVKDVYPSYVDYVFEEAINKYGFSEEDLLMGGLQIYTQMDPVVQKAIERAYANEGLFPENSGEVLVQSASIVVDPYSGGIRGLVGYRGKHFFRGFNRATQLKRQPGSSIKPLAVYAPALEMGYEPDSMLLDEKTDFGGYIPTNYDGNYQGSVTLYDALVHSINVPTVALLNEIDVETGINFLKRCGIPLHKKDQSLSIALGGLTEGVSPLQMAQAFSIFPNLGSMYEAHAITKITSGSGKVLLEVVEEAVEVTTPENAYTMTEMLMGVVKEGTGENADLNRPTAGKTGTTQLPSTDEFKGVTGARDAWFIGYSPELVAAVWVGYDKLDPKYVMDSTGGDHPAKIFKAIMSRALRNIDVSSFPKPENYKEKGNKDDDDDDNDNDNDKPGKRKKKD